MLPIYASPGLSSIRSLTDRQAERMISRRGDLYRCHARLDLDCRRRFSRSSRRRRRRCLYGRRARTTETASLSRGTWLFGVYLIPLSALPDRLTNLTESIGSLIC